MPGHPDRAGGVQPAPDPGNREEPLGNLLCVANFPSNTGFAWTFIEGLYASLAARLEAWGVATWVAYPELKGFPETLRASPAEPLELPIELGNPGSLLALASAVRQRSVRTVYFCDRPTWHPAYGVLRAVGVRTIVVHDHSSGSRDIPGPTKAWAKRLAVRVPGFSPDRIVAVSDYVLDRLLRVNLAPSNRVVRIWNSVPVPRDLLNPGEKAERLRGLGLDPTRPAVGCASRATPEKGIASLLRAFEGVWTNWSGKHKPQLLYMGEGPAFPAVARTASSLKARGSILLAGYVPDAADVLGCMDLAVVPSLWEEAFGLAALEPLARGVPVVASSTGGLPEVVRHGETGILVPPGDDDALEEAITLLLSDRVLALAMGNHGRQRALVEFDRERQMDQLEDLFRKEMTR